MIYQIYQIWYQFRSSTQDILVLPSNSPRNPWNLPAISSWIGRKFCNSAARCAHKFLRHSGTTQRMAKKMIVISIVISLYKYIYIYHLVIQHSHGKSLINGGINGKIIYKWAIYTMAMLNNQRVYIYIILFVTTVCVIMCYINIKSDGNCPQQPEFLLQLGIWQLPQQASANPRVELAGILSNMWSNHQRTYDVHRFSLELDKSAALHRCSLNLQSSISVWKIGVYIYIWIYIYIYQILPNWSDLYPKISSPPHRFRGVRESLNRLALLQSPQQNVALFRWKKWDSPLQRSFLLGSHVYNII